ncbi:MAG: hypothetical protein AVDCRST_MAG51-713 [uncultured Ramlibacter sp.]|uniref:Lipoprotein n=1 Tax=uncultured Ramlibacter sp. TaxID=260755 RepID=A0A6J4NYQ0_9BURK|nr:MAG: hypothetical protein AVDCRST_MAG51-713 [uncultured Ramlibacter sp.]
MAQAFGIVVLLTLAGCSGFAQPQASSPSACSAGEATYACQVERYNRVSG